LKPVITTRKGSRNELTLPQLRTVPTKVRVADHRLSPLGLVLFPSPTSASATLSNDSSVLYPPMLPALLHQRVPSVVLIPGSPDQVKIQVPRGNASPIAQESAQMDSDASSVRAALDQSFYSRPRTRSSSIGDSEQLSPIVLRKRHRAVTLPSQTPSYLPPEFKCPDSAPPPLPTFLPPPVSPSAVSTRWTAVEMLEDAYSETSDDSTDVNFEFVPMPSPLGVLRPISISPFIEVPNTSSIHWSEYNDNEDMCDWSPGCPVQTLSSSDEYDMSREDSVITSLAPDVGDNPL